MNDSEWISEENHSIVKNKYAVFRFDSHLSRNSIALKAYIKKLPTVLEILPLVSLHDLGYIKLPGLKI